MTIGVCMDCHERHPACWGTCERYLAARAKLEAVKAEELHGYHMVNVMNDVQYNGLRKYRKKKKGN